MAYLWPARRCRLTSGSPIANLHVYSQLPVDHLNHKLPCKRMVPGFVGYLGGTGFLLDQQGHALTSPEDLGRASINNGSLAAGLFPFFSGRAEHAGRLLWHPFRLNPSQPSLVSP